MQKGEIIEMDVERGYVYSEPILACVEGATGLVDGKVKNSYKVCNS